jgi:hypothetical protein
MLRLVLAALAAAATAHAFDGVMPNPSSIGDFEGTVALVYLKARATGGDGHRFLMLNDMRVMTGDYLAADGSRHHGSFAFI